MVSCQMLGGMFSIFVVMLLSDWDLPPWSCIVRPVGGVCANGFMTTGYVDIHVVDI